MRRMCVLAAALALGGFCSFVSAQDFSESFDSYTSGTALHGVGGWKGWSNSSGAGAPVSSAYAHSGKNSVEVVSSADLVHEFTANGGLWEFSAMQYVPSGTSGEPYFILLNQYDDAATANDWSVQLHYVLGSGTITSEAEGSGEVANLVFDQWVQLRFVIDLDNNTCEWYYHGDLIETHAWDSDGHTTLRAVDLYSNSASSVYYDDIQLIYISYRASDPSPADRETDVLRGVQLSWNTLDTSATHNVYFSASYDEVATASAAALVSEGQRDTTFGPGQLEYGKTYYWRVDVVDGTLSGDLVPGQVWSFAAEPFAYVMEAGRIKVTASSAEADKGPENTINGSGLDEDQHSTELTEMWLTAMGGLPAWIHYEFDRPYKLYELWVWNSNYSLEYILGYGAKDVTIQYSTDGETWTQLPGASQFDRAAGTGPCAVNTVVSFDGIVARYVKLTINTNWGGFMLQASLSEVRFLYIPVQARLPEPEDGETDVSVYTTLQWQAGREAHSHQVYLGTDANDMAMVDTVDESTCAADLDLGATYYWKVIEVNDAQTPSTWEGDVWTFSTEDSLLIDGFETYNDDQNAGTAIFQTWIDGYGVAENGSLVGYDNGPFAEETLVLAGSQSMPFRYDNTGITYSECELTFDEARDWTEHGVQTLSLYFMGDAANTGSGQLYVKVNGTKVLYGGSSADLNIGVWQPWTIDLASATGVNLKKVTTLAVGVQGSGATGTLFFDEIRLYPTASATVPPVDPGTTGLVAYYPFDGDATDAVGNHDGTLTGSPGYATGMVGKALHMTSDAQYASVVYAPDLAMNTFTVAAWFNVADLDSLRAILGTRIGADYTFDLKAESTRIHGDIGDGTAWLNTSLDISAAKGGVIGAGEWHHIAYVIDNATQKCYMCLDGALGATAAFSGTPLFMKSTQTLGIGYCSSGEYMHGQIDEVRIYNRVLSGAEIAGLAGRTGTMYVAP